jgi:hypothetical protein
VHNPLHIFCKQKDTASALDILLDIKKLYPLISRHADQTAATRSNVSPENFLWNKQWVSIT